MDSSTPQPADDRSARPRRLWRPLLLLALATATAGGAYAWHRSRSAPPPSPPAPPPTAQFLNTKPGVAYVGSERCAECHADVAATYAEHPMGRSVSPPDKWLPAQHKAASAFQTAALRFEVKHKAGKAIHREYLAADPSAAEITAEVAWIIGSGRQGQSFLVERDGRLFQSPISWYVDAKKWNLSPAFARRNQHFSRIIPEACLLCHCNEAHLEPGTLNRFVPNPVRLESIGCERCHGPGELHVAAHRRGEGTADEDRTIVNPRRLSPQRREAVCEQCHLQGEARIVRAGKSLAEYRPGLPLEEFVSVFVQPPNDIASRKAVSHVEQMHASRCFQASTGQMGCISCHDPHVLPSEAKRVVWYRDRCLRCHAESSCSLPLDQRRQHNAADSCIECHMPRGDSSNIAHTSITNHRIVRRPASPIAGNGREEIGLVSFHSGVFGTADVGERRDLGLALGELAERAALEPQRRHLARQAWNLLRPVADHASDDVAALEGLGQALWRDKRPAEALIALEKALQKAPKRELALGTAALVTLEMRETARSIDFWRRLLAINPHNWQTHAYLGQTLALRKKWTEAVQSCREALRLNPFEPRTRMLLIDCLVHLGEKQNARDEFKTLLALGPDEPEKVRKWFDELLGNKP
ncbi:MAG TPA: tetratricopeptide repeat protein [Gemmataceae bacterium]